MFDDAPLPPPSLFERWFAPDVVSSDQVLVARWIWLRALGAIFFSAFLSLQFQIIGLIGARGILPAASYLTEVRKVVGLRRFWLVPSLLWINSSDAMLHALVWIGFAASIALIFNLWPRVSIAIAAISFLSFIAAAQDFAGYQSDGMLLEAALLSIFFAPPGLRPRLARDTPPSRAALFMLRWEWFRIYFESGVVKIVSGEEQWRNLTAMDKYYENGPLPTWIGWYTQQLPHTFHAATAAYTLLAELFIAWLVFFPKKSRLIAFILTTPLQIGIILTANYAFLNYLVLFLGVLLLNDRLFHPAPPASEGAVGTRRRTMTIASAIVLLLLFVTTVFGFLSPSFPLAVLLDPFRVANNYGLFAVMTRARYEIELQGTSDGKSWIAYPFRYKAQDPRKPPGIFAPYQPRFDWNLWFASLGPYQQSPFVLNVEERLLESSPPVLQLFAGNPFPSKPPVAVRSLLWQYWFTTPTERARTGAWWNRRLLGAYAPTAVRAPDGSVTFE